MELFKRQQAILSDMKKKANEPAPIEPAPIEPLPEPTSVNTNDEIAQPYEWKPNATAMERLESLALEVRFVCVCLCFSLSLSLSLSLINSHDDIFFSKQDQMSILSDMILKKNHETVQKYRRKVSDSNP